MFPEPVESNDSAAVDKEEPADLHLPDVAAPEQSDDVEPISNQDERQETEETENSEPCPDSESNEAAEQVTQEDATDTSQSDSGEFVVTVLAKAKLEEQGIGVKGRSSPLLEAGTQETPAFMTNREEDVTSDSWRQHRKHVFVLSEAGKPIYSRYGSEEALSSTMGVMMALVSFVQSGDNIIRSVYSGESINVISPSIAFVIWELSVYERMYGHIAEDSGEGGSVNVVAVALACSKWQVN